MLKIKRLKANAFLLVILLGFGLLYSSISLVNHYNFRTSAQDLGMFNHALYCFSHFQPSYYTLSSDGTEVHYLADHFSPITILYSPFYYLFGNYTALLIQIFSILFGALGVYRIAGMYWNDALSKNLLTVHFLSVWGIYSALGFDFHNNVVAAMLIPWFILYWKKKNHLKILLFYVLLLMTKENIPLWLCFVILGLIIEERNFNWKKLIRFELPLLFFSAVYFLFVVGYLQPHLIGGITDSQLDRYAHIGDGLGGMLEKLFDDPRYLFSLLFESHEANPLYIGVKSELYFALLLSGGLALVYKPEYLLMLVPVLLQKMLADNPNIWSTGYQYSVEFVPVLTIAVLLVLAKTKCPLKYKQIVLGLAVLASCWCSYLIIDKNKSLWYDNIRWAFYKKEHYQPEFDRDDVFSAISKIPDNEPVSAITQLTPFLERREKLYMIPHVKDANYVVTLKSMQSPYPLSREEHHDFIDSLKHVSDFNIFKENESMIVFKRVQ